MKIIIDAKELRDTLKALKPWVPVKPHHKITEHMLITSDHLGTHFTAYDFEAVGNAVRFPVEAFTSADGSCVVKFRDLLDLTVKSEGEVTMEFDDIATLTIRFDHTSFTLKARPASEFPDIPSAWYMYFTGEGYSESMSATFGEFARAVNHVRIATSTDGPPMHFTRGIMFDIGESGAYVVGTDGRRLHYAALDGYKVDNKWSALIPADIVVKIAGLKASTDSRFEFGIRHLDDTDYFAWSVDCIEGFCSLMDTPYPEWDKVIPTDHNGLIEVSADNLARCIDRLSPIAKSDDGRDMIVLTGNSALKVSAKAESKGSGESIIECNHINGPDMLVALNYSYLLDILKLHKGMDVHLIYQGDLDPVMVRQCGDGKRSSILMPVRLPEE